jgi:hypothetical protein
MSEIIAIDPYKGPWREVSAKRIRKIRKTHWNSDIRPTKPTSTGKSRYLWRQTYGIWMRKSALYGDIK